MPKKSKRVAVRQAQLSGRAKRERAHGPSGVPATRPVTQATGSESDGAAAKGQHYTPTPVHEAPGQEPQRFATGPAKRQRSRTPQRPPIEMYFPQELRRIGMGMGVVAVLLVVLMFVLQ